MIRALIIDDESDAVSALQKLLRDFVTNPVTLIGSASNLDEGMKIIDKELPDLVFLDINLSGKNGLEIYNYYRNPAFKIIFVTAYEKYAIDALKKSASDYLIKPVNFVELNDSIRKVSEELKVQSKNRELTEKISKESLPSIEGKSIVIDTDSGFTVQNSREIVYCYANESYSTIVCHSGKEVVVSKPLKALEELLPPTHFYRTHKSFLVNIYFIAKYIKGEESYLLLRNGKKIPVSVRKKAKISEELKNLFSQ